MLLHYRAEGQGTQALDSDGDRPDDQQGLGRHQMESCESGAGAEGGEDTTDEGCNLMFKDDVEMEDIFRILSKRKRIQKLT